MDTEAIFLELLCHAFFVCGYFWHLHEEVGNPSSGLHRVACLVNGNMRWIIDEKVRGAITIGVGLD